MKEVFTVSYDPLSKAGSIKFTDEFKTWDSKYHVEVAQMSLNLFTKMNKELENAIKKVKKPTSIQGKH
jgi:hypothetical protein